MRSTSLLPGIFALLVAYLSLTPAEEPDEVRKAFDAAAAAGSARKHAEAAAAYEKLLNTTTQDHPLAADIRFRLAEQYAALGQQEAAAKTYLLLQDFPASPLQPEAFIRAGEQWRDARQFDKAHEAFRTALEKFKDKNPARWWDCHWRIVDCYRREDKSAEALAQYATMLGLNPDARSQCFIYTGRIEVLRRMRQWPEALAEIDKAAAALADQKGLARHPYATLAEEFARWKAETLRDAGRLEEALAEYRRLVETAQVDLAKAIGSFEAAQLLRRLPDAREQAHDLYVRAYELAAGDMRFRERIITEMLWNAQELGKPETGEVAVIKLTFADKDVAVAGLNVLERFYTDGRVRKPESVPPLIRKVLALELPADQKCPLQARLINALRVAGQIEDGLKELAALKQEFGSQDKTKPAVQLAEADFYRSLGRLERAAKVYEQYLKDSGPGFDPGVLRLLAEILLNLGEERRAFEVLKQAWGIPNFRDHGWVVERLADLSLELADYETCKKAMAEILAWQGNERQKAERQARATASSRLEEIHAAAKALPDKTEGGTLLNLDFAGQSELPLPLSSAALSQATLQKDKDGVEAVVPAGKDMAVADFRFNLAKPKQGQVKLRCKVVPEFAGRQPDEFQAVFQLDDRGCLPWSSGREDARHYPIVPLSDGPHRLRILLPDPEARLTRLTLQPVTEHVAGSTISFEAKWGLVLKGEKAAFDVQLNNLLDSPVTYPVEFVITDPQDKPVLTEPAKVAFEPNGLWRKHIEMPCPATGPLKASVRILTDHGLAAAARNFGVIFKPTPGLRPDSWFLIDARADLSMLALFGVKWIRWELSWRNMEPSKGVFTWGEMDALAEAARRNQLYAIVMMSHAPHWAIEWGGRVPAHRRGDDSPSTAHLDDYANFCAKFAQRYGDVVRAYCVWNEPWEGGSISGYGACGYHYRRLTKALWRGLKSVDKTLLVGGNDSSPNLEDNFACEKGFIEKYLDIGTVHTYTIPEYMGHHYFPDLMRRYGKPSWDTESWQDSRNVVKMHAVGIAHGLAKLAPFHPDHIMGPNGVTRAGCVYSALIHFLEDTKFHKEVNPHCLPWMFVFKGEKKNAAIVFGDMGNDQGNLWSQIKVDGQMVIDDPRGEITLYDTFGNPQPWEPGKVTVPMSAEDFFLTTTGDVDAMCEALAKARLTGFTPVECAIPDFTKPLEEKPPLRVRIKNALNEPLEGTVAVEIAESVELATKELPFKGLESGKTLELSFPVKSAKASPANVYPVRMTVKTNRGEVTHEEGISVAVCARGSPFIDGNVMEWQAFGAIPVFLRGRRTGIDYWGAARYMWMEVPNFQKEEQDFAKVATMYDSKYFYFMAKVKTAADYTRKSMRSPDAFEMMPPPAEYAYKRMRWAGGGIQIAFDCVPNPDDFYPPDHPYYRRFAFRQTDYEYAIYPTADRGPEVWRFLAPGVPLGMAYPFSPRAEFDQDVVDDAKCAIYRDEKAGVWSFEAAIPLTELKELKPEPGKTFKFSFLIPGVGHWSEGRSTCKLNVLAFHPYWSTTYSVETEWGFAERLEPD